MTVCRVFFVLGVALGLPSLWETLSFSWDPTFQAPALRYGPTHTNYYAFREFTLTIGALLVMAIAMFQPARDRTRKVWLLMFVAAACYYGGWCLPWSLLGLYTPTLLAELVHEAAALTTGVAVVWSSPHFPPKPRSSAPTPF